MTTKIEASKVIDLMAALKKSLATNPKPVAAPDGWVPCEERLPENASVVLGCSRHGSRFIASYFAPERTWTDDRHGVRDVTHWRPLPEGPKP